MLSPFRGIARAGDHHTKAQPYKECSIYLSTLYLILPFDIYLILHYFILLISFRTPCMINIKHLNHDASTIEKIVKKLSQFYFDAESILTVPDMNLKILHLQHFQFQNIITDNFHVALHSYPVQSPPQMTSGVSPEVTS